MVVIGVKVGELVYNRHDIHLDSVPTLLEERAGEAVRSRRLITSGVVNAALTSSSVKGSLRPERLQSGVGIVAQLKFFVRGGPLLIIFLK